jgi:hypothetical protein
MLVARDIIRKGGSKDKRDTHDLTVLTAQCLRIAALIGSHQRRAILADDLTFAIESESLEDILHLVYVQKAAGEAGQLCFVYLK